MSKSCVFVDFTTVLICGHVLDLVVPLFCLLTVPRALLFFSDEKSAMAVSTTFFLFLFKCVTPTSGLNVAQFVSPSNCCC